MKVLLVIPLGLLAASCAPQAPYYQQRPPMIDGEPYYPYARDGRAGRDVRDGRRMPPPGPARRFAEPETGNFEPIPPDRPAPPPRNRGPQLDDYDPDPRPAPEPRPSYPEAKPTNNPNQVISPYSPYNVIDVEGFKSGALAKDPSNGKIFRVP